MWIRAGILVLALASLPAITHAADPEQISLRVIVNDTAGKPATGVQLYAENVDIKGRSQQTLSNSEGQAVFRNLAPGTYKISALENRTSSAAAGLARVSRGRTATVTLGLAKLVNASNPGKKHKRYVYVSAETGTHIGGGRWVEVDDDSRGTGANPVDKRDPSMLTEPQSFGLRAFQGPSH